MLIRSLRLWPLWLAAAASLGGWTARGWYEGARDAEALQEALSARQAAELAAKRAADVASDREAARLAAEAARADLARQLEDMAHADNDTRGGLPRARVDRLRQR